MTYTAIWIIAYLVTGEPVNFSAIVPGDKCSIELADSIFRARIGDTPPGVFQDGIEFWCDSIKDRPTT